jgi:hypothetical protein
MIRTPIRHHTDGLLVLLLFGVFAACILSVLLTGADAYQKLTERDRTSYDQRTAVLYLATKVRQGDLQGSVWVEDFQGRDALVLAQQAEGETYLTRIYCEDGYLRELFSAQSAQMSPEDGEKIFQADALQLSLDGGVLRARLLSQDSWQTVILSLRSGEGAAA